MGAIKRSSHFLFQYINIIINYYSDVRPDGDRHSRQFMIAKAAVKQTNCYYDD